MSGPSRSPTLDREPGSIPSALDPERMDPVLTPLRSVVAICGLLLLPNLALSQLSSGLAAKSKIPALKVVVVTGDNSGQEVDVAGDRKEQATVYVFIQAERWDRPTARFLKVLDTKLAEQRPQARIYAVWLTDNVEQAKEYLPKAQQSLQLTLTSLTVHPGDKNGPNEWGINADASVTAVIGERAEATESFGYRSLNETDVPALLKAFKEAAN